MNKRRRFKSKRRRKLVRESRVFVERMIRPAMRDLIDSWWNDVCPKCGFIHGVYRSTCPSPDWWVD